MQRKKDIQALFFDFDGTIADTERIHWTAFREVLRKLGFDLSWDEYLRKYLAYTDEDFFRVFFQGSAEKYDIKELCIQKSSIVNDFIERGAVPLYPAVDSFIRYMAGKYPMCIVSGALKREVMKVLENHNLHNFFDFIVSSEDYDEGKPSSQPFEVALKKFEEKGLKLIREGCIAFEDSLHGVEAAKKAGFFVVGISNFYKFDELKSSGADIVIDNFSKPELIEDEIKYEIKNRVFDGEKVILNPVGKHNTFYFTAKRDADLHTHLGIIRGKDIVGKRYGETVVSSKQVNFFVLEPTLHDRVMKLKRKSAIIYPKDSAFMIFMSGISSGSRVIESGCGSGGLTISLAHFVKPTGKVYAYEIRDDFIEILMENLKENGLDEFVEVKKRDVYKEGFDERDVDAVFLDLPEPWHCVKHAWKSLKASGVLVSVSPTVNQTEIMCEMMRREGFVLVDTFEVLVRRFLAREGKSRPFENMIAHTAYITIGRKVMRSGN